MRHGDAFAGIGGFGVAARRVGWETVWACEIEQSARNVYRARLGTNALRFDRDIRDVQELPAIDVLTGGFPCQDLSIAGRRVGLSGERSSLFFELVRILEIARPAWLVFENVPGLLSSNDGRDMGVILSSLVKCGYGVCWRVLNSRFFGLAQNRERVFFVGHHSGSPNYPAQVLFDTEGEARDSQALRESQRNVAHCITERTHKGGDPTTDTFVVGTIQGGGSRGYRLGADEAPSLLPVSRAIVSSGGNDKHDPTRMSYLVAHALTSEGADASYGGGGQGTPLVSAALRCGGMADDKRPAGGGPDNVPLLMAFSPQSGGSGHRFMVRERPGALSATQTPAVYSPPSASRVRAGTRIRGPLDVCPQCIAGPDSPRYRGLGNAVSTTVAEWIFRRIAAVNATIELSGAT